MGQGNVPAIPELFYIQAPKWSAEVVRQPDTQNIGGSHCHEGIACKIKEQVEAVQPGVACGEIPGGVPASHGLLTYSEKAVELGAQRQLVDQAQQ